MIYRQDFTKELQKQLKEHYSKEIKKMEKKNKELLDVLSFKC